MECENCGKEVRDNLEHWSRGYERWFCSRREKEQSPTEAPSIATGVCQRCDGKGYLRIKEKDEQWTSTQPCPDCKGTGKQSGEKGEVGGQDGDGDHIEIQTGECIKCGKIKQTNVSGVCSQCW